MTRPGIEPATYRSQSGRSTTEPLCRSEEFQDGHCDSHRGYRNRTILAILNLCVIVMPPINFWLNPTYCLGGDVI